METVGHKLRAARLARKLSFEDVARATRMRPNRIEDLENDEYSTFPNIAYARSFLLLYAKYLEVDVSDSLQTLQASTRITADDYDYLQNAPMQKPARVSRSANPSSAWPILLLVGVIGIGLFVAYLIKTGERLGPRYEGASELEEPIIVQEEDDAAITAETPDPVPTATPEPTATPVSDSILDSAVEEVEEERIIEGLPVRKAEPVE